MLKGILLFSTEHEMKGAFGTEAIMALETVEGQIFFKC